MTDREKRWVCFAAGWGFAGLAATVAGYPQWSWIPFSIAAYWIGYRAAFSRIERGQI